MPQRDQCLGVRTGQWRDEHSVDYAEDAGGRANAEDIVKTTGPEMVLKRS
jgi:hypothetical protein